MLSGQRDTIDVHDSSEVVTISLSRPESLNAINTTMLDELHETWNELASDPAKAVLLRGQGDTTCAGADENVVLSEDFSAEDSEFERRLHEVLHTIQTYPQPTAMACKGAAVGAGFALALECDFAIVGESTTFSYPETRLGLFSDRIPKLITHLCGSQVAREVVLRGKPIPPEEAHTMHLVSEVVPEERVDERAGELIQDLAEIDDDIIKLVKNTLRFEQHPDEHVSYP